MIYISINCPTVSDGCRENLMTHEKWSPSLSFFGKSSSSDKVTNLNFEITWNLKSENFSSLKFESK